MLRQAEVRADEVSAAVEQTQLLLSKRGCHMQKSGSQGVCYSQLCVLLQLYAMQAQHVAEADAARRAAELAYQQRKAAAAAAAAEVARIRAADERAGAEVAAARLAAEKRRSEAK